MSGDWLAFAREIAPDVVFRTGRMRLVEFGAVLVCLLLGARWGSERCQPLFRRALLLGLGGLTIALIASLWLPVELLVQGQAWRVLWLLLPLAMIALLDLAQQIGSKSRVGPALLMLAAAVASLSAAKALTAIYLLGLGTIVPARWWLHLDAVLARWRSPLNAGVGLLWLLLLPGIFASWDLAGSQMLRPWWSGPDWIHGVLAGGVWHIALLPVGLAAWRSHPWPLAAQAGAVLVLAALTLVVLAQWDRRTESRRSEESCFLAPRCPPHPFRQLIDVGATVSWPARETTVWFILNRASYYGEIQRTGAVFSLAKFDEWTRRDRHMATGPEPAHLCRDPLLDWLVVAMPAQGVAPKAEAGGEFLYSCADFRAVPQAPTFSSPRQ